MEKIEKMDHIGEIEHFISSFDFDGSIFQILKMAEEEVAIVFEKKNPATSLWFREPPVKTPPKIYDRVKNRYGPEAMKKMESMTRADRRKFMNAFNERQRRAERNKELQRQLQEEFDKRNKEIQRRRQEEFDIKTTPLRMQVAMYYGQILAYRRANLLLSCYLSQMLSSTYTIQCSQCKCTISGLKHSPPGEEPDSTDSCVLRRVWRPF